MLIFFDIIDLSLFELRTISYIDIDYFDISILKSRYS
jgi:hypothetical protein